MTNELIILTGIPGSGKTTLAKTRFMRYKRINLDTLESRSREVSEILRSLENRENLIIDNTNTTVKSRKRYLDIAKTFGIPVKSVYLRCPIEIAIMRNRSRKDNERVPDFVVRLYSRKLVQPSESEGFDSCEVMDI